MWPPWTPYRVSDGDPLVLGVVDAPVDTNPSEGRVAGSLGPIVLVVERSMRKMSAGCALGPSLASPPRAGRLGFPPSPEGS